jgi:hypothetical protein
VDREWTAPAYHATNRVHERRNIWSKDDARGTAALGAFIFLIEAARHRT